MYSILYINRENVPFFSNEFLEEITQEKYPIGKSNKTNWVLKTTETILSNGSREIDAFNTISTEALRRGYQAILIEKKTP